MSVQAPVFFLARERNLAEEAWPGDIIGIPNHGSLRIGDTLTENEAIRITGLPSFAPEILRRVKVEDPMRSAYTRGVGSRAEAGRIDLLRLLIHNRRKGLLTPAAAIVIGAIANRCSDTRSRDQVLALLAPTPSAAD